MKMSNILYTSVFTLALGAAAPFAVADNTGTHGPAATGTTQESMDQQGHDAHQGMGGHSDGQTGNPGAPGASGTGTTAPGSSPNDAPTHTPGGTNPDGAPDTDRSVE